MLTKLESTNAFIENTPTPHADKKSLPKSVDENLNEPISLLEYVRGNGLLHWSIAEQLTAFCLNVGLKIVSYRSWMMAQLLFLITQLFTKNLFYRIWQKIMVVRSYFYRLIRLT